MANIYLLRHGKVSGDAALYGHSDVSVADNVNQQIVQQFIAQALNITQVYSSPLQRCAHLADKIARHYAVQVTPLDDLKEMNFGNYDGVAFDEVYQNPQHWQTLEKFWQNPVQHPLPKAELLTGFSYRVLRAWQLITEQVCSLSSKKLTIDRQTSDESNHHDETNQHDESIHHEGNNNILVVCHGGVIRMILAHLLQVDFRNPNWYTQLSIANGSLTSIRVENGELNVTGIGNSLSNLSSRALTKQEKASDFKAPFTALTKSNAKNQNKLKSKIEREIYPSISKEVLL